VNLDQRRELLKAGLTPYYRNVLDQFEAQVREATLTRAEALDIALRPVPGGISLGSVPDDDPTAASTAGAQAAEWHRYLHAESILLADDTAGVEAACGPWHHRVFLGGPTAASTDALRAALAQIEEIVKAFDISMGGEETFHSLVPPKVKRIRDIARAALEK
jgi:hypothetical protein